MRHFVVRSVANQLYDYGTKQTKGSRNADPVNDDFERRTPLSGRFLVSNRRIAAPRSRCGMRRGRCVSTQNRLKPFQPSRVSAPPRGRSNPDGDEMSDTYIIEVSSEPAGIVVRDKAGFRFFAASHRFNPLEGRLFRSAREAERVARELLSGKAKPEAAVA